MCIITISNMRTKSTIIKNIWHTVVSQESTGLSTSISKFVLLEDNPGMLKSTLASGDAKLEELILVGNSFPETTSILGIKPEVKQGNTKSENGPIW